MVDRLDEDAPGPTTKAGCPLPVEGEIPLEGWELDGLLLVGTVKARYVKPFDRFVKVVYEVETHNRTYQMCEFQPFPFNASQCLARGETGAWSVDVSAWVDKQNRANIQIVRRNGSGPAHLGSQF